MQKNKVTRFKFDFHDGVQIKQTEIDRWHDEMFKELQGNKEFELIASGNSMVFAYKQKDGKIIINEFSSGYVQYQYDVVENNLTQSKIKTIF